MNTQTLDEIVKDEQYSEGFNRATKLAEKKYNKLFEASRAWFVIYESAFGAPDKEGNTEYWTLRKILKLPS